MGSISLLNKFIRVSETNPCPVCEKDDWCLVSRDGARALCQREESDRRWGDAGWLHDVDEEDVITPNTMPVIPDYLPPEEIGALVADWCAAAAGDPLYNLATELGVSPRALEQLNVGWRGDCYSFPMRDGHGDWVGVRFRGLDGRKWSLRGGREGLFSPVIPDNPWATDDVLLIAEGATDTAALLTLGLFAVGRPNCSGGFEDIKLLLGNGKWPQLVIVSDNDDAGVKGAKQLATRLRLEGGNVTIIKPRQHKDARECVQHGMSVSVIMNTVEGVANPFWKVEL